MAKQTRMGRMSQLLGLIGNIDDMLKDNALRVNHRKDLKTQRTLNMNELLDLRYKYLKTKVRK